MFTLKNVSLGEHGAWRLKNVSLTISDERTAIVGYSGAGKTSLLNLLAGFEEPGSGAIMREPVEAGRLPLYWVPQNGGLWPHLSVSRHLQSVNNSQDSTDEILKTLDLEHRRASLPEELSQGERSRLALARALATGAKVLLMDEPLSHVDPIRKPGYWVAVREFMSRFQMLLVFSSHEPETVLRQSGQVICLQEGSVAFQGSTRELYDSPPDRLLGEFLGPLNWFDREDAQTLGLPTVPSEGVSVRPERLQIVVEGLSSLEFMETVFKGAYQESIIRHVISGRRLTIKCRTEELSVSNGQRVALRVV